MEFCNTIAENLSCGFTFLGLIAGSIAIKYAWKQIKITNDIRKHELLDKFIPLDQYSW